MRRSLWIAALFFATHAAFGAPSETWIRATPTASTPVRGVALVIHGLNLRPDRMLPLAGVLNAEGIDVLNAGLSGHNGSAEEFKQVTRPEWLREVKSAYSDASAEARRRKLPLYFLGYSLGALLAVDLMNGDPEVKFDKMILLAPALSITRTAELVTLFRVFGGGFTLPSAAEPSYRANASGTPMAAYQALLESLASLRKTGIHQNVPTLVLIDPDDMLVSLRGLRQVVSEYGLDAWKIAEITNIDGEIPSSNHHLIIDEKSVGPWVWERMRSAIHALLTGERFELRASRTDVCGRTGAWKTLSNAYCEKDAWPGCNRKDYPCKPVPRQR